MAVLRWFLAATALLAALSVGTVHLQPEQLQESGVTQVITSMLSGLHCRKLQADLDFRCRTRVVVVCMPYFRISCQNQLLLR